MEGVRFFTPEEARAALPTLRPRLAQLRDAWHAYRFAKAQVDELVRDHGAAVGEPGHAEHAEWRAWDARRAEESARVQALVDELNAMGVDVKDPLLGLVDFYARRRGKTVLLCYRDDEDDLRYWHPLETGFRGRRPLSEF